MSQQTFADIEYSNRKRKTKREKFLNTMEQIISWSELVEMIRPYYPSGKRGRKPRGIEIMLRMYLMREWFNLSDEGIEDAIYDSYAMRSFLHLDFLHEQVPDSTTLLKFRHLLKKHELEEKIFADISVRLDAADLVMHGEPIMDAKKYINSNLSIKRVADKEETAWINPYFLPFAVTDATCQLVVSDEDIEDARERLQRFASFIKKCFPETEGRDGLIESPIAEIPNMQKKLEEAYGNPIPGRLLLKLDSHLAIAGSIKARGGIYEVLKHAEDLAIAAGKLSVDEDYAKLANDEMKAFFGQYTVQVGSTGNLGLSIGITSAELGFKVKVHMSADAKQWKKDLLRSKGVEVIEYADDYSKAVAKGRKLSDLDPMSYFVDDEKSVNLFLGYAVAAKRLKDQLDELGITVDEKHPLIVYIPAGVGGAPGGVAYGLKRIFRDNVHCFFTEPTLCPSVLLGIATQKFEGVNVHDFGISGITEADGLTCASPSGFVTRIMTNLLSGEFTIEDARLYDNLRMLYETEGIQIEPSSCAAFAGPCGLLAYNDSREYCKKHGLDDEALANSVQIAWATGGRLVPEEIRKEYLDTRLE